MPIRLARAGDPGRPHPLAVVLLLALVLGSLVRINATIPDDAQQRDAGGYVAWAQNLARNGVYGVGEEKHMNSAPLLSASIAVALLTDPRHAEFRASGELTDHRAVRQVNLIYIALLLSGSIVASLLMMGVGRRGVTTAAFAVLLTHFFLLENPEFSHGSLQELPTAGILAWTTVAAIQMLRTRDRRWTFALGALGGLLALSRAVFLYVMPVFLVLLVLLPVDRSRRERATTLAAMSLAFALSVGPWLARNVVEFGEFSISDSGGHILLIRDVKNDMTPYQHRGAWVHFSPEPLQPAVARVLGVDRSDFLDDGPLRPLVRHLPDPVTGEELERTQRRSFYRQARDQYAELVDAALAEGYGPVEARTVADRAAIRQVSANVREQPTRFLRTTPVFLYRSAWPMNLTQLWEPEGVTLPRLLMGAANPLGMVGILALGFVGVLRRRPLWFAIGGLPTGMVLYHALVTHALFRYTRPVAGIMLLAIALGSVTLWDRTWSRFRSRA